MANVIVGRSSSMNAEVNKILRLTLPKFSKGYCYGDFLRTFLPLVSPETVTLGRLKYPNQWIMTVKSVEKRDKILQKGTFTVRAKKCVVSPFQDKIVCGRIHWLPSAADDLAILEILKRFGEISHFVLEDVISETPDIKSSVRFFVMILKPEAGKEDIPHFIKINDCEGLIAIRGREPICFGCKAFGHMKSLCPTSVSEEKRLQIQKNKVLTYRKWRKKQSTKPTVKSRKPSGQSDKSTNDSSTAETSKAASAVIKKEQNKENLSDVVTEVNNLHNIVTIFGQKLVDVLSTVTESVTESPASTSTAGKKSRRKRKKKKSANVPEESPTANEAVVISSNLSSQDNETQTNNNSASATNCDSTVTDSHSNEAANVETGETAKKKKKKKKKTATVPVPAL